MAGKSSRIAPKRKISEMLWEFAGEFIRMGDKDRVEAMSATIG